MLRRHPLEEDLDYVLSHTEDVFQNLRDKEIFISGGTGFIGKWLLESFIWANSRLDLHAKAHVLSRNPDSFRNRYPHLSDASEIQLHKGDVRDFTFPKERIDFIIHAATDADAQVNRDNPLLVIDTTVDGTRRMLDFARQCEAKRFLLTSSGAVYGKQPPTLSHMPEDYTGAPDPSDPASAYGEGKRLAELLCSIYHREYGIETTTARCFAFVGPYLNLDIHYAVGNFIRDGLAGGPIRVTGDGTPCRSYMYAADLVIWLWSILFRGRPGHAYNVGSDEEISIGDLARRVSRCFPGPPDVITARTPTRDGPALRYVPCIDLARREMGLRCWIGRDDAIARTVRFHQQVTT